MTHNNHDGVVTHLQSDILECEVKWALGSIIMNKASGCDGIPAELFKILKDSVVKSAAFNISANSENWQYWKTGVATVPFNPKERQCQRMYKLLYNCTHFAY